ncbi:MAG: serine hydrolase domain-containing protein [Geodermatophilaceae bacterium]
MSEIKVEISPDEVGMDGARLDRIEGYLQRHVDAGRLPGFLVAVTRRGQVAYLAAGGRRHIEDALPVETDTLFRIYSMTKPITSVAAMMLYEEGAFELNDPIAEVHPSLCRHPGVRRGLRISTQITEPVDRADPHPPPAHPHLGTDVRLSPTPPGRRALPRGGARAGPRRQGMDSAALCDQWASFPLLFQPGSEWNYSVSTDVIGRLVEVLSGQSLGEFFRRTHPRPTRNG